MFLIGKSSLNFSEILKCCSLSGLQQFMVPSVPYFLTGKTNRCDSIRSKCLIQVQRIEECLACGKQ